MTPRDRLNNRYMVNFVDFKSNYCRVFVQRRRTLASICVLRTDAGTEYQNVDLFCKKTGVTRQKSEADNQASNGKAGRMHLQYAAYILNRSPTNANAGKASPLKGSAKQKLLAQGPAGDDHWYRRGNEGVQGVFKDRVVVTTQHVKNIETLDKKQNAQVQRLYLQEETSDEDESSNGNGVAETTGTGRTVATAGRKTGKARAKTKKTWKRDSLGCKKTTGGADESAQQEEPYRDDWAEVIKEELDALEKNGVWRIV
ncbi:hypothetical protein PHMEG_00038351, partial [Phytophthora megakarya]